MKKYYTGILILALVTLGLTGYVVNLGLKTRQDVKTEKSANDIATKLNSYIQKEQKIPKDLKAAGVTDAPGTISYTKDSEKAYTFCVTYKEAKGYGSDITSTLTSAATSRYFGSSGSESSYKPSSLYLSYIHKKGENCQTVEPYLYNRSSSSSSSSLYNSTSQLCDPEGEYYEYYKDYCGDTAEDLPASSVN